MDNEEIPLPCFHERLLVVGMTSDSNFLIDCQDCGTQWVAPCVAEGVSARLTDPGLQSGCEYCREDVMNTLRDNQPEAFHYVCPTCKYEWKLTRTIE